MFFFKDFKKAYGSHLVLDGISLEIKNNEIIGLIGRNGAGKSTLFGVITGSLKKKDGSIFYNSKNITNKPDVIRTKIGIQLERSAFYPNINLKNNLNLLAILKNISQKKINKFVELLGLKDKLESKFETLSHGQKKRVSILSALIGEPELILFDEPTVNLDPEGIHLFYDIVSKLKEEGKSIIISSHLLTDISNIADRIVLINNGKIVLDNSKNKILTPKYIIIKTNFMKQTQKFLQTIYRKNETIVVKDKIRINYHDIKMSVLLQQLVENNLSPNEVYVQKKSLMDVFNEIC